MSARLQRIAENVRAVRDRIIAAAERSGRSPDEITLVAVTKYVDADITRLFPEAGCTVLGESRPQQLWQKAAAINDPRIKWHMIGHLQRNKARRTLRIADCIESTDSLALIEVLEREAARIDRRLRVLLEVNVSGDPEKHGFSPAEAMEMAPRLSDWEHLCFTGLMTMAARSSDAQSARSDFATLRHLRDQMQENCPAAVELADLSMGMSRDFETAIEEGATLVRVGSALVAGAV